MQRSVLVCTTTRATKAFHIILQLGLHDTTDSHDVATDARVNQVIFNLAVDSLRHLASIHVLDIVFNLLYSEALEEGCLRSMFLGIEDARATVK